MSPRATGADKVQENRVRRIATRRGYTVEKSKRRDTQATDYGRWTLTDAATDTVAAVGSINEIEEYLNR